MRLLFGLLAFAGWTIAQQNPAVDVLQANCTVCHGAARMSGLDLRSRETMLTGGARGPAVAPGKASESLLIRAVLHEGGLQMPPGKKALSAEDIRALRDWIDRGAPWDTATAKADPGWWSLRTPVRPAVLSGSAANAIDSFVTAGLRAKGLRPVKQADKLTLVRRAYFDLHGLPPSTAEIDAFVSDTSANAWEKLIDRLLASPRYGERWGRHWLDVVRYADTGGYETDILYANAWRYRDYVIDSFNQDKPFDVFTKEQIAADEIWPDNLDLDGSYEIPKNKLASLHRRLGTGLYTVGPMAVEFTFFGDQYRAEWQSEAVDTTGAAFLGLSFACARCHNHKFDPISQRDYYRFAALFGASEDREIPVTSRMGVYEYTRYGTKVWALDQLKNRLMRLEADVKKRGGKSTAADRDERETLLRQIGDAYVKAPVHYPTANVLARAEMIHDVHVLERGDFKSKGEKVTPGFPAALHNGPAIDEPLRRKALAEWMTSRDNPLLARVIVNRIWQGHFGRGIVATANDFGRQGEAPTHPELLDWLAVEMMDGGWSIKRMHRLIMTSETYRRSSAPDADNAKIDADNVYLWRMNRKRLEAESLRDAVLASAATLNLKMGGQPIAVPLTTEELQGIRDAYNWPVTSDPAEHNRRSVYLFVKRSFRLPMFETFDAPDPSQSCARRDVSTVAPQALTMLNSDFMQGQAVRFADRLRRAGGDPVQAGFRIALGREPSAAERERAAAFLEHNKLENFCLLLFNLSEFVYVD